MTTSTTSDASSQWAEAESIVRDLARRWFELLGRVSHEEYGGYQDQIYPGDFIRAVYDRAESAASGERFELDFRRRLNPALSQFLSRELAAMSISAPPRDLISTLTRGIETGIEKMRSAYDWRSSARHRESLHFRQLPVDADAFEPMELRLEAILYGLYVAWRPSSRIIIPDSRAALLNALLHDRSFIRVISPRQFEELIAYVYETLGCRVQLTQATRDFGADILVWHQSPIATELMTVVQTKRYLPPRKVGLPDVLPLPGSILHYGAESGQLVASTNFTGPAMQYAEEHRIRLVDIETLHTAIDSIFDAQS